MGFENRILAAIDRRRERGEELPPVFERAYQKASRIFVDPHYSINETEFVPVYGEKAVNADRQRALDLKHSFESSDTLQEANAKKIADVFEGIILTQSELSEWLGEASTLKTTLHDDYINKVDMIAEWRTPTSSRVVALAVDATFGFNTIEKKILGMKREIDTGKLGSIRYFRDEAGNFMGTRNNVPRTVIGVSKPVVARLAQLWIDGERRALGEDPIQRLIVTQIAEQLRAGERYARSRNQPTIVSAYQETLQSIEPLEKDKEHFQLGDLVMDPVAAEITAKTKAILG